MSVLSYRRCKVKPFATIMQHLGDFLTQLFWGAAPIDFSKHILRDEPFFPMRLELTWPGGELLDVTDGACQLRPEVAVLIKRCEKWCSVGGKCLPLPNN